MPTKFTQVLILSIVFGLQYLFEHVFPQRKSLNIWKNERFNLGIGIINIIITLIPAWLMVKWLAYISTAHLGLFSLIPIPTIINIIITVLVLDCWLYWWHKFNHVSPFLWRFHKFHHRDENMNTTTALRFHTVELLFSYPGKALICLVFGISYSGLIVYECLFFTSVVIHHSNIRVSKHFDDLYSYLFISPNMHRVHHSIMPEERNNNYGALFSFWDKIFKSFKISPVDEIKFGI